MPVPIWLDDAMSRLVALSIALALTAAACGGGASDGAGGLAAVPTVEAVIGTTPPTSTPEGVAIPNVSLTLADGSTLDFAEVDTPMMIVFWAEW